MPIAGVSCTSYRRRRVLSWTRRRRYKETGARWGPGWGTRTAAERRRRRLCSATSRCRCPGTWDPHPCRWTGARDVPASKGSATRSSAVPAASGPSRRRPTRTDTRTGWARMPTTPCPSSCRINRRCRHPPPKGIHFYRAMLSIRGTSHGPVSVSVSVCHKSEFYRNGWTNRAVFLALELHSTYPTLCYKKTHVSLKIRVLPSGILLQTLDLEYFATTYRSSKRAINLARKRWTLRAW